MTKSKKIIISIICVLLVLFSSSLIINIIIYENRIKSADNLELIFYKKTKSDLKLIVDKTKNKDYNYNVYIVGGKADIIINKKVYSLEEALNNKKTTMDEIVEKAKNDYPNAPSYDDGGSVEYHYSNYTIIKKDTIDGNLDVFIGDKNISLSDVYMLSSNHNNW